MNMMINDKFEQDTGIAQDASARDTKPVLARLMKAWETRNARNAKRAAGMSLIAVTLAACGGSGGSNNAGGENGEGENGNGENGGTTPVPPSLAEPNFIVLDFPTKTVNTTVFNVNGQPVSIEDALAAFAELAAVDLPDGDTVTIENLNVVQDGLIEGGGNSDVENTINIGGAGSNQQLSFDEFLNLMQTQDIITVGRVILTPQENSGIVFAPGFATGDQFEEGEFGTAGNPGSGDDVIFLGRTELLHAAIIDGGAGNDELVIVAKGNYAQPSSITNIETIRILNSENTNVDVIGQVSGQNILTEEEVNFQIVSTFPTFNSPTGNDNTWIDLGSAFGLTSVVLAENSGVTDSDLFVIGVNNAATLVLQGGFENNVTVSYGLNFGGAVFNLRLEDVNFDGGELLIAQNSTHLAIESTGSAATVENFIEDGDFGGNLRQLTITGDKFLNIDDEVEFNESRPITIDASANTGGVKLEAENDSGNSIANNTINLIGSQGDDDFTLEADAFNITSGAGNNTFDLTGSFNGPLVDGMRLVFDGAAGTDTIVLNGQGTGPAFEVMLAGSAISGADNTIVLNTSYSVTEATLDGIVAIDMAPGAYLAVTPAQVAALGADVFSVINGAEAVASLEGNFFAGQETPVLGIILDADATLADLIDVSALDSGVKLAFRIPDGVTLTLTAEELHTYVADPGIWMGNDDTNLLQSVGNLVITNAGQNFDAFNSADVDIPGLGLIPGGGTVFGSTNNVTVERSADGFDRPSQVELEDALTIDSSDGPVTVEANGFGEDDEFTIPQTDTLIMVGDNDITFNAPVSFNGQPNFTIDFSELEGAVTGLEVVDFHDITTGAVATWGQVIGNGGARIDVQLDGNVGNASNGLISSGVATYVVTDLNDGDRQFWVSDPTEDLEVLGLQGNAGDTITFGNVRNGTSFLMEGDGFASFEDVPKALEPLDKSNIGTLQALFNAGSGTVNAVVAINNQGVELGAASDGGLRELYVDGIIINGAQTVTVNIADGDAAIGGYASVTGGGAGISGDVLETIVLNNADDVSLTLDAGSSDLEAIDATGVDGTMTLVVLDDESVDLSGTVLTGIDAIVLEDDSDLTLTVEQLLDIGIDNVSVDGADDGNEATLTLNVTEDFDLDALDLANLPDGLTLELSLQSEVELNVTGEQLLDLLAAEVAITDGSDAADEPGTLNVTGFTQANLQDADGNTINYATILPDAANIAGTITTDGSEVFVPQDADGFLGDFAWELEGGTLGLTVPAMANGLNVNNGDVQFFFTSFNGETIRMTGNDGIDAEGFTNIGTIFVTEFFETIITTGEFNVESIAFLDDATEIEIVPLVPLEFDGANRFVIVGGVPFAIDDDGTPFNPATGDAGPVTSGVNLLFNNVSGDDNRNVETVTLAFNEGGNVIGNIEIGAGELPAGNAFQTLTLISNGDDVNTVEDIFATAGNNDLLNVAIFANEAFDAQTITLSALEADADGIVTIDGTADVTLKAIDASNANVDTLTVDTLGHSGTLDITGGSPSITTGEELTFAGVAEGTILLDTEDGTGTGNLGVDGNGELVLIDASGMAGTLALGDVDNLADGFELIGGTGVITANILALPADNWSLDIGNADAGSQIDFELPGGPASLTAGAIALATDEDTNETTLTFGEGTVLAIDGPLDLSGFDAVVFGDNVVIELGEDGLVTMDDDTFAAFDAAGGTIIGETDKTFDEGIDLTDVRGLTEINIEEGAAGTFTLSSDQIGIARIVDDEGEPVSDFGDIQAINDEVTLAIVVKEGVTFEEIDVKDGDTVNLTDNAINGVAISGDGAVITTIEGFAGAQISVDAAAANNDPGQMITVNFTLDGVPGSATLNNSATNFASAPVIRTSLAGTLNAVAGLNASVVAGGVVEVQTDEPGVAFVVTSVTATHPTPADAAQLSSETAVVSVADMSGNAVEDTTHVFPTLGDPAFYVVTGTLGGGAEVEIEGANFIDLTGAGFATAPVSVNITGVAEVKLPLDDLDGLVVTGDGSAQADVAGANADIDLSEVDVPLQFNVDAGGASLTGDSMFNPGQPLTLVGPAGVPAPGPVFDITGLDTAGDVPNLNRPSTVDLDNVDFTLTAAQADGLVVTGSSQVTVVMDGLGSDNSDLSGIGVDLEITSGDDVEFGGNLPLGQPIAFSGGSIITLNGNTIPAGAVVTIAADTTLDVTGAALGAGVSFVMEADSVLTITGAQADGTPILGAPDADGDPQPFGTVDIRDLDGSENLDGIDGPTLALTFADDAVEGAVAASAIDGRDITIEGGDPAEDFALTITGLEDAPNADLTGLTLALATAGNTDVVIEVDSTGGATIGEDADLTIGGATSVTLGVTGTGSVDVADGANLSGIGAFTVAAGATLVADQSLTANSIIAPVDVSGDGTLEVTGFAAGDSLDSDTDGVAQQVFVFGDDDFGVQIGVTGPVGTEFDNTTGDGTIDALDLNAILDVQGIKTSVNVSGFGTGNDDQILNLFANAGVDVSVAANVVTAFDGATAGSTVLGTAAGGEENFLAIFNDDGGFGDNAVWFWQDGIDADGGGTNVASDGIVGASELTLVADMLTTENQPLSGDNFVV